MSKVSKSAPEFVSIRAHPLDPRGCNLAAQQHDGDEHQLRHAAAGRADAQWSRRIRHAGPVSPRRIPFRAEKQDLGKKFSGTDGKDGRDGKRGKGNGVTNAATAALALSNTQTNTVRIADALQRLWTPLIIRFCNVTNDVVNALTTSLVTLKNDC